MRIFQIQPKDTFVEFELTPFEDEHEEVVLEDWLESNPDAILKKGEVLVIGRQVRTDLDGYIDLLCLDRQGNVIVVELKRGTASRNAIGQALEYVSSVAGFDAQRLEEIFRCYRKNSSLVLAECHRNHFGLDRSVHLNKDQRIVIVGQQITPEVKQTAEFLNNKGLRVTCVEFKLFEDNSENRLLAFETVIDEDPATPSPPRPPLTEDEFMAALDENGRNVLAKILDFGKQRSLPIWWGSVGFALRVEFDKAYVVFCYGYLPDCRYGQSFYTSLLGDYGVEAKSAMPEEMIRDLHKQAIDTGLFSSSGKNLKFPISRRPTETELNLLLGWCESVEKAIREYGLKS
ncbi:MAG: DUF91 domain-containing protein [Chloroflexi bacterium]|nr:DUF91 domain-containing protein [Chloroflexota bacterium]